MSAATTYMERLRLRNYRRFEEIDLRFHPELTVLVADNGGGKTALLDGISVALRPLVNGIRIATNLGFQSSDVRLARAPTGAMVAVLPTSLEAEAMIDGRATHWHHEHASLNDHISYTAEELEERARELLSSLVKFADRRSSAPPERLCYVRCRR